MTGTGKVFKCFEILLWEEPNHYRKTSHSPKLIPINSIIDGCRTEGYIWDGRDWVWKSLIKYLQDTSNGMFHTWNIQHMLGKGPHLRCNFIKHYKEENVAGSGKR